MLPSIEDYREFGRMKGKSYREFHGKIEDWIRFVEFKSIQLGTLADLRAYAGYDDLLGKGTYKGNDPARREAYEAILEGFRQEAC